MPHHAKVLDICLRTKVPISDIYRGLPVNIHYLYIYIYVYIYVYI